jgi:hypothetical protein
MSNAVLDFSGTSQQPDNSPNNSRLGSTEAWPRVRERDRHLAPVPRTRAIVELAAIGLADQAVSAAKAAKRRHRSPDRQNG